MHVKKGDTVKILTGKDRGKTGKVLKSMPKEKKVIVEGLNLMKKNRKPRRSNEKGQIVDIAMPIHASNVAKTKEVKTKTSKKTSSTGQTKKSADTKTNSKTEKTNQTSKK